jgi:hypothetical protein
VAAGVRLRGFTRSLLFAVAAFGISNVGAAAMDWLKQLSVTPTQSAAVSTGVGLVVVFFTVVLDRFKEPAAQPAIVSAGRAPVGTVYGGQSPAYPQPYQPVQPVQRPPKPQRRVSWAVVILVIVGLLGIGGFAVTWGVQWLNGKAICLIDPKHYPSTQRLGAPAQAISGRLGIEVTQVMLSRCGTVITVHAVNGGDAPLSLPVFGNTSLTVPGRTSLGGDPRTSDWNDTVPPGGEMTGILVFRGVPADTRQMVLNFNRVYGRLDGPAGVSVQIRLSPVAQS